MNRRISFQSRVPDSRTIVTVSWNATRPVHGPFVHFSPRTIDLYYSDSRRHRNCTRHWIEWHCIRVDGKTLYYSIRLFSSYSMCFFLISINLYRLNSRFFATVNEWVTVYRLCYSNAMPSRCVCVAYGKLFWSWMISDSALHIYQWGMHCSF